MSIGNKLPTMLKDLNFLFFRFGLSSQDFLTPKMEELRFVESRRHCTNEHGVAFR